MSTLRDIIYQCPLFEGISEQNLASLLNCLDAKMHRFKRNDIIFSAGQTPELVGIVTSGRVNIVQDDYWGNRSILSAIGPGGLFAESFSCADIDHIPVSVIATLQTSVLMINYKRITEMCESACVNHTNLIKNMLKVIAGKNINLMRKIEHITKKTTKEKVLSYLSEQAFIAQSDTFAIPFNRQELADYLSVERSALSNTLSKMRSEGMLSYKKNVFVLNKNDI